MTARSDFFVLIFERSRMSKVAEENLPDSAKLKNGDFVDGVARLIGKTRLMEILGRVGGSRKAVLREARLLLQKDRAPELRSNESGELIGKDASAQCHS